jgi:hypothetical protein
VAAAVACLQLGCAEPEQGRDRLALAPRPELSTRQPSAAQSKSELTTLFQQLKSIVLLCAQYFKYEPHPELVASLNFR